MTEKSVLFFSSFLQISNHEIPEKFYDCKISNINLIENINKIKKINKYYFNIPKIPFINVENKKKLIF